MDNETLADFHSHRSAWRKALEIAAKHAEVSPPDIDEKGYWLHELAAFDRVAAGMPEPSSSPAP